MSDKKVKVDKQINRTRISFEYIPLGLMLLSVIAVCAVIIAIIFNLQAVFNALGTLLAILSPVIYGIAFAYLMNPVAKLVEGLVAKLCAKRAMAERKAKKLSRALGVVAALIVFGAIAYALVATIVPEVTRSLTDLLSTENLDNYYKQISTWLNSFIKGTPLESLFVGSDDFLKQIFDKVAKAIDLDFISNAASWLFGVGKGLFNAIIGIVVAIYMLLSKDRFQAQAKKITVSVFRKPRADRVLELSRRTNKIFGGFIVGKLIDSSIIGVLCYIGMLIIGLPYAMLISVIVGISNIIPFLGPLIGGILGGFLILLQNPLQALYFVIFVLALQQVDGNIIGPRVLGDRLGISDFWILVSITVFGGLFGFAGMLLGVPLFTLIYSLVKDAVDKSLRKKGHTTDTPSYYSILAVDDLAKYQQEYGEPTVVYSEDTYETEFDPEDDIEYDDTTSSPDDPDL